MADAPGSLMFVRAHYRDSGDVAASLDVVSWPVPGCRPRSSANRYDDLCSDGDDDERLAAVLNGATDAQIGALGEATAAVLLEHSSDVS